MKQSLDIYGQNCTYYCFSGVSTCSRVGKVCNEHCTFLYPTLDRGKLSVTLSTTSSYEIKIVSSHQITPRTNLEKVMTKQKSNEPTGHCTNCQPSLSRLVGAGVRFDFQSKRRLY